MIFTNLRKLTKDEKPVFCIMSILMVITVIAQDKTFQSDKLTKIWESPTNLKHLNPFVIIPDHRSCM